MALRRSTRVTRPISVTASPNLPTQTTKPAAGKTTATKAARTNRSCREGGCREVAAAGVASAASSTLGITKVVADLWARQDQHGGERTALFAAVANAYPGLTRVLYPGSWVDVSASCVFPHVAYVDSDKQAARFFKDPGPVDALIASLRPAHLGAATWNWHAGDYMAADLPVGDEGSYDALLSFYAGPITDTCRRFVRRGGIVVANNSHGDAGIAAATPELALVGVVLRRGPKKFAVVTKNCDSYMVPKRPADADLGRDELIARGRGVAFTKPAAAAYVFKVQ